MGTIRTRNMLVIVAILIASIVLTACSVTVPDLGVKIDGTPVGPIKIGIEKDIAPTPLAPASGTAIPTTQPTPGTNTVPTVLAPVDCGPWSLVNGTLVFQGNMSQDVCQLTTDLEKVRAGTPSQFVRTSKFSLAICAASVKNVDTGQIWTYTDCDQAINQEFPSGTYQIVQPTNYSNGGYRATNK